MEKYNYMEAVTNDVLDYIAQNDITVNSDNRKEIEDSLNESLWADDSVTGNASGSYTFCRWTAQENLCHNLDLLGEACAEFGCTPEYDNPEACDVTIRCYLLGSAISAALNEAEAAKKNSRHGDSKQTLGRARGRIFRPVVLNK